MVLVCGAWPAPFLIGTGATDVRLPEALRAKRIAHCGKPGCSLAAAGRFRRWAAQHSVTVHPIIPDPDLDQVVADRDRQALAGAGPAGSSPPSPSLPLGLPARASAAGHNRTENP